MDLLVAQRTIFNILLFKLTKVCTNLPSEPASISSSRKGTKCCHLLSLRGGIIGNFQISNTESLSTFQVSLTGTQ